MSKQALQSYHCFSMDTYLELRWILWTAISVPYLNGCVWIADFFFCQNLFMGKLVHHFLIFPITFSLASINITTNPRSEHNLKHPISLKSNAKLIEKRYQRIQYEIIYLIFNKNQSTNSLLACLLVQFLDQLVRLVHCLESLLVSVCSAIYLGTGRRRQSKWSQLWTI